MDFLNAYLSVASLSEAGLFHGIASDAERNRNDVAYAPSAFNRSLADHKRRGSMPAMLLHHDMQQPVGRWLSIEPAAEGLKVSGKLAVDTTAGGEAYRLLKAGALPAMSTGAFHLKQEKGRDGRPVVTEADLVEISLVSIPANPNARIIRVNSLSGPKEIEAMFCAAGMSSRKAKAMSAAAWRSIQSEDEAATEAASTIIDEAAARLARFKRNDQ